MAKMLVVDDDTAVQATVRLLLERAGHSVVTTGDGRKGLALIEAGEDVEKQQIEITCMIRKGARRPSAGIGNAPSGLPRGGHHDPDQIGGVPRSKLLHDIGAVILDRSRADPEMPPCFLVGRAGSELLEHLAFAAR